MHLQRVAACSGVSSYASLSAMNLRGTLAPLPASTELTEIMGIRLMLTNLFRPLATGQKLTPEAFDNMVAEIKKRKRSVAEDALQDLERAS